MDNCGKDPVDKRPWPRPAAKGEGVGPAGKGHRNGSPANILFCFLFLFYFLNSWHNVAHETKYHSSPTEAIASL